MADERGGPERGMRISWSGFAKRELRDVAWAVVGVRARFFVGRLERGSADVGIDSGPSPDIAVREVSCVFASVVCVVVICSRISFTLSLPVWIT